MKLLLDTHVWLWWQMTPERLSPETTEKLSDAQTQVFLSTVSSWEMGIKIAAGKLQLPKPLEELVPEALAADGMQSLAVQHHHAFELMHLPMHHRDPFDRMLIAQARKEKLTLVTADSMFEHYDVLRLSA